jgi:tetratricopeptide (TPR) repeat protein
MALACALCMGAGILCSGRLAYAELISRQNTAPALARAAYLDRFTPPADYFLRLADLDLDRATHWLDAALQANPRLASAWIAKGLADERNGDFQSTERDLIQAASVDHRYLPAWTLTNFYFRQNLAGRLDRTDEFWIWARRAAALTYDDFRPLLALAHAVEPDPRRVIESLGDGEKLLRADLDYLAQDNRLEDAQQIARLLFRRESAAAKPRLIALADLQIRAGHVRDALELWNAVSTPLDSGRLDRESGALANGDLATAPSNVAFDWRLPGTEGCRPNWQPGQITFSLSGEQPEVCALLEQIVALDSARGYRLRFEYQTSASTAPTGLVWELEGVAGLPLPPAPFLQPAPSFQPASGLQPAPAWHTAETVLVPRSSGPGHPQLSHLRLLYRREPGAVGAQGQIRFRNLRMKAQ